MKALTLTIFLGLVSPTLSSGQEEPYRADPCAGGNKKLKEILSGKVLQTDITIDCGGRGGYAQLCSSMLPNAGIPPRKEDREHYDSWSCFYSPANLSDNDPSTAWVEGIAGDGIGELVITSADASKKARIWGGYGKSEAAFHQNSRPKKIKLHVIKIKSAYPQCGTKLTELSLVASSMTFSIRDFNGYQDLPEVLFKKAKSDENEAFSYRLAVEIIEAYPGTKYKDLCISEVSN